MGGDVTMNGLRTCWFGLARDWVGGYVAINVNKTADPDAIEALSNHIGKSLACAGNRHPGVSPKQGAFAVWDSADATQTSLCPGNGPPGEGGAALSGIDRRVGCLTCGADQPL